MPLTHFYWHRQPAIDAALLKHFDPFLGPEKLVVDVGAGYDPWPYATEFVDREAWPQLAGNPIRTLDVELDRLPYADKEVDFVYCRHTIEDLHNPTLLLREMNRVAKAGYIETPSPIAEFSRGTNGPNDNCRGCPHHYWFAWNDGGTLSLLPKCSALESAPFPGDTEAQLLRALEGNPARWNTYFLWSGSLEFKVLRHRDDFDFSVPGSYICHLERGINLALAAEPVV